ncbi:MAG: hypothetical protein UZ21_OP11001000993 [Microgenomates bacterium OLB22]|nr:MAG: hypothetical protein UZ21_OP11001000993 [Microgenomates bacterium OLB22]
MPRRDNRKRQSGRSDKGDHIRVVDVPTRVEIHETALRTVGHLEGVPLLVHEERRRRRQHEKESQTDPQSTLVQAVLLVVLKNPIVYHILTQKTSFEQCFRWPIPYVRLSDGLGSLTPARCDTPRRGASICVQTPGVGLYFVQTPGVGLY